jgi:hypothetical protein
VEAVVGALRPPTWGIVQLGYPAYILSILGIWKILGAIPNRGDKLLKKKWKKRRKLRL